MKQNFAWLHHLPILNQISLMSIKRAYKHLLTFDFVWLNEFCSHFLSPFMYLQKVEKMSDSGYFEDNFVCRRCDAIIADVVPGRYIARNGLVYIERRHCNEVSESPKVHNGRHSFSFHFRTR